MDPVLQEALGQPGPVGWGLSVLGVIAGSAAFVGLFHNRFRNKVIPVPEEEAIGSQVQFEDILEDGTTIRCYDGTLVVTISIAGVDIAAVGHEAMAQWEKARKNWLDKMTQLEGLRFITFSSRRLHDGRHDSKVFDNPVLAKVQELWQRQFLKSFRNGHHLVIWVPAGRANARKLLSDAVAETQTILADYSPVLLDNGIGHGEEDKKAPLVGFWASLLNPGRPLKFVRARHGSSAGSAANVIDVSKLERNISLHDSTLGTELGQTEIIFNTGEDNADDAGLIEFGDGGNTYYARCVSVTRFGDRTSSEITQKILSVPGEIMVTQWIEPMESTAALALLENKAKEFALRPRQLDQVRNTREYVRTATGDQGGCVCRFMMVAFVFGGTKKEVERTVEAVRRAFSRYELSYRVERRETEALFLQQFPPNDPTRRIAGAPVSGSGWVTEALLTSMNVAGMMSFETPAQGQVTCDWGPYPVAMFRTSRGSPYAFCFHISEQHRAPGHTLVIGPTGGGKTVLMMFLALSSLRYEEQRTFILDRGSGAYAPIVSMGGTYLHLATRDSKGDEARVHLNPFDMDLRENEAWIIEWLSRHVMQTSSVVATEHIKRIVQMLQKLPPQQRTFDEIIMNWPSDALKNEALALQKFGKQGGGEYSETFSAARDTLAEHGERLIGIDLGGVLDDENLSRVVLPYLMFRIEKMMSRTGKPWLVMLDEAPAMWNSQEMQAWTRTILQEARKNRGVLMLGIQRLGNLREANMTDLVTQCPTRIILPTDEPSTEYQSIVGLDQNEIDIIGRRSPSTEGVSRPVLIKREGAGSVVVDVDLGPALNRGEDGNFLYLLQSGQSEKDHIERLRKEPDWVSRLVKEGYPG